MNKKLLAAAVAGALALPGAAMAQVTISGVFKVSVDQYSKDRVTPSANNDSEMRITDNSSRIIISVTEDLGGGLAAIGQWDLRAPMDTASSTAANGNTYVGLRSNSMGTLTFGRWDLHYGSQPDDLATKAGALMGAATGLMDFTANGSAIANATRTHNVVKWDSPTWGGFALTAAYSTQPFAATAGFTTLAEPREADLGGTESGQGYNLKAQFTAANWQIGGSIWSAASDGATAVNQLEQDSQVVWGYVRFGGFKIGAAMNVAEITSGGTTTQDRVAYTIPISFTTGPHNFYAHYTIADDDDATVGVEDGATMMAVAYVYDLSKRTSVGVTFAQIDNDAGAAYNFFTNTGALASVGSTATAGEDQTLISFTLRHAF